MGIREALAKVVERVDLSEDEAAQAMQEIVSGGAAGGRAGRASKAGNTKASRRISRLLAEPLTGVIRDVPLFRDSLLASGRDRPGWSSLFGVESARL